MTRCETPNDKEVTMYLRNNARQLRTRSTQAERRFWSRVRAYRLDGHKFKRQEPIGPYIVDFVCFESKVIVELDGGQHHGNEEDKLRDAWLQNEGFSVLRFWNNDVLSNTDGVIESVLRTINSIS